MAASRQLIKSKFLSLTIEEKRGELSRLCLNHGVHSLSLFGSAITDKFDPDNSDLDFLVDFKPMSPAEHAEHYFDLMEDLQTLFGMSIDLVELAPIRNPYFRAAVEGSRVSLYDAA